jgi:hypothetical protein
MHPYIAQLLSNERIAEMHRSATATRKVRQARSLNRLAKKTAAPKRPELIQHAPVTDGPGQVGLSTTSRSAEAARHSLRGRGTGLALATRPDEDIAANDQALRGICDDI